MIGSAADHAVKTADDLVEALVSPAEYRAVLQYARDHGLEKDNAVLFMVAMLKLFAHVYDRLIAQAERLDARAAAVREESLLAEQRLSATVGDQVTFLRHVMGEHVRLIGHHTAQMNVAAGEMKVLREQMEKTTRDAERTLAAFETLKDTPNPVSLTTMFEKRLTAALHKRVPAYDEVFNRQLLETITLGMGRYFLVVQAEIGVILAASLVLLYILRH